MNTNQRVDPFAGTRSLGNVLLAAIVARIALSVLFLPARFAFPIHALISILPGYRVLEQVVAFVVIVLHIVWLRGYFVALNATGRRTKQSPNWTIAGWFIPFANAVLPCLSVKQAYDAHGRNGLGIALPWWIAYLVFTANNAMNGRLVGRIPYGGLLLVVVLFGLWFVLVKGLLDATRTAAALPYPGAYPAAAPAMQYPGATPFGATQLGGLYSSAPPPPTAQLPAEWGWSWINQKASNLKALGYYYRDKMAGPSMKLLVDLNTPQSLAQIAQIAQSMGYRSDHTLRLGAHMTMNIESLPPADAAMMRARYDSGEGPAPGSAMVLRLTREECAALGLPPAYPQIELYLQ